MDTKLHMPSIDGDSLERRSRRECERIVELDGQLEFLKSKLFCKYSKKINMINVNTELRKLRPAELYNLGLILNPSDNWKKLMASVIKDGTEDIPKFSGQYISIVEQAACQERKLAAAIFLEEWATMGKKRPTIGLLLNLLMKTQLFRAADYLAEDILKVAAPQRPASGPAAPVDIDAITNLLLRQNLEPESTSKDSNFCVRTTDEIHLNQINYPMCVFDNETSTNDDNLAVNANDVGVIEMQYAESRSNQVLEPAGSIVGSSKPSKEISDLIKFSTSGSQNLKESSRADMLKFDSERIEAGMIPDLNVLCSNSSLKGDSNVNANCVDLRNAEMTTAELPACLERFGASDKSSDNVDEIAEQDNLYFHRELMSAELPLCINNKTINSGETNLSAKSDDDNSFAEYSSESLDNRSSESLEIKRKKNRDSVPEIPFFVVESERRGQTEDKKDIVGYETGYNALNSYEIPITVLEFQKR